VTPDATDGGSGAGSSFGAGDAGPGTARSGPDPETPLFRFGEADARLRCVTHSALLLVAAVLAGSLLVVAAGDLLRAAGFTEETAPVLVSVTTLSMNFVGFLTVGLGYVGWRDARSLLGLRAPTRRDLGWIVLGSVGLAALVNGLGLLADAAGLETAENVVVGLGRENPELFVVLVPVQFLLTAPAEELLFRGLVQGLFRPAYGAVPAVLIASALFGLVHYPALAGSEGVVVVIGILTATGLLLGALYEYTGNLLIPVFVHAIWNALLFATLYLQAT